MNMKTLRKILAAVCATALIVCISVGATIAYLTDDDSVENTFTVGKVEINLDEAETDTLGKPDGDKRTETGNKYQLYPGHTYVKDPTITVNSESENCYVVAKVVVTADGEEGGSIENIRKVVGYEGGYLGIDEIVKGGVFASSDFVFTDPNTWENSKYILKQYANTADNTFYVFFKDVQTKNDELVVFETLEIPQDWTNTEIGNMKGLKMDVSAYAVQEQGFENVQAAFKAAFPTEQVNQ